jgi:hypothetical protein
MPTQTRDTPRIQTLTLCVSCQRGFPVKEMWPVPLKDGSPSSCCFLCKECQGKDTDDAA